jgi:hypothetical protein
MNFKITDSKQPGFAATLVIEDQQEPVSKPIAILELTFEEITSLLHVVGVHYREIGMRLNKQVSKL